MKVKVSKAASIPPIAEGISSSCILCLLPLHEHNQLKQSAPYPSDSRQFTRLTQGDWKSS